MKTRILFLLLLVCGLSFSAAAQDNQSQYKLRELSASEYLGGILGTMSGPANSGNRYFPQLIDSILISEYPNLENENWEKLLQVYDRLGIGGSDKSLSSNREEWNRAIIYSWLRENQIDLSKTNRLQFADYDITVTPRDFNNDGTDEYVLDVIKGAVKELDRKNCSYQAEYVDYLIVQENNGDIQVTRTPLPWFSSLGGGPFWRNSGGAVEMRFDDINADGLPEWVIAEGGQVNGGPMAGYESAGQLYILGWRNGKLTELTLQREDADWNIEQSLVYSEDDGGGCLTLSRDVTWDFANLDDDPALEILEHQVYVDNWYCKTVVTKRFDWDKTKDRYSYSGVSKTFNESQNCEQRQAEETLWTGDYLKAIPLYEKALTLPQYQYVIDENDSPETVAYLKEYYQKQLVPLNEYLYARLALAYIMTGQSEKAESLIKTLQKETITDVSIAKFVEVLSQHIDNPLQACFAAYDTFTKDFAPPYFGITIEQYAFSDRPYLPENIGCNAPKMLNDLFTQHSFGLQQSPVDQIKALGIETKKVLRFDLNNDGQDEWLIWMGIPTSPYFFVVDGEHYTISQIELNSYLRMGEISTWELPENSGKAIIFKPGIDYYFNRPLWFGVYDSSLGGVGGDESVCITQGRESQGYMQFLMWRMNESRLVPIFDDWVCQDEVKDLFLEGEGSTILDGGTSKVDNGYDPITINDLKYVWDSSEKTYKRIPTAPTPTPVITSTPKPVSKYDYASGALQAHDYQAVVEMTNKMSLDEYVKTGYRPTDAVITLTRDYYLRALALQHLGREQEAIEALLKMIEFAPDEQWKKLAMLYLEPV